MFPFEFERKMSQGPLAGDGPGTPSTAVLPFGLPGPQLITQQVGGAQHIAEPHFTHLTAAGGLGVRVW